ncbi:MAG: hypothetical protein GVY26_06240 [Bacteroidetes bacterium]|jgi:hypothetical protein|nr:hypothetical protein [Bacteroidota bacterium]
MTNRKKDLFDLFREQQHQFDATPSPRAWRNLEQRLDSHRRRNRLSIVRNLSMAAALLLIAVIVVVLAFALERNGRQVNKAPLAVDALQADDVQAAEELRLAVSAQRAERHRQEVIQEGGRHQKLIPSTLSKQPDAAIEPSLTAANWLLGPWQSATGQIAQWEKTGPRTFEGELPCYENQKLCAVRIEEAAGQLQLITGFGRSQEVVYDLKEFHPRQLVFENKSVKFPKQIRLNRDGVNSYVTVCSNPAPATNASTSLSNKPVIRRMERLRLQ